jgi:hypothetical protein
VIVGTIAVKAGADLEPVNVDECAMHGKVAVSGSGGWWEWREWREWWCNVRRRRRNRRR